MRDDIRFSARPGQAAEALGWMERAVEAAGDGNSEERHRAAVRAKQSAPRSVFVREHVGVSAFELGAWHEAAQELLAYRRLTGKRKHDALIAESYRREGRPERALEFLEGMRRAEVTPATWVDSQIVRARALADRGKAGVGIELLKATPIDERTPGDAHARLLAAIDELAAR